MDNTKSLHSIKIIAKDIIGKYAPDEVRYFNIIWKRFLKDGFSDVAPGKTSILTFAEHNNVGLFSPSILFILRGVIAELSREIDRPTYDQVENAVHSCAVALGASKDIAAGVKNDISERVYKDIANLLDSIDSADGQSATNHTVVINSVDDIRVDGRKVPFDSRQPRVLLCELIRNNTLHWSIAYLLFPEWHDYEIDTIREKFVKLTHKINMKKYGLVLRVELIKGHLDKPDYVRLEIPENVTISGDMAEALVSVQDAKCLLEEGKDEEAMNKALAAYQQDAECLDAMLLFSKAAACIDSNMPGAWVYIDHRLQCNLDLRIKVKRIIQNSHMSSELNVSLNPAFERCEEEIGKIDAAIKCLAKATGELKDNLTSEEYEFFNIVAILHKMNSGEANYDTLLELCKNNNTIAEVFETVLGSLNHVTKDELMSDFTNFIFTKGLSANYDSLDHLKAYWVKSLKKIMMKKYKIFKGKNYKSFEEDI